MENQSYSYMIAYNNNKNGCRNHLCHCPFVMDKQTPLQTAKYDSTDSGSNKQTNKQTNKH